jgi:5'-deoxynucleotidase YfbR-like HD superfamily hydrolase
MQTLRGKTFDLLDPHPSMVDFKEIADQLSTIHRYAGAAEKPVSVARHTLIAFDAAQPQDRAAMLLHDAHEVVIGDIITPAARAIFAVIDAQSGAKAAEAFKLGLDTLKFRLDAAIFAAAGVALPSPEQRLRMRRADLIALRTERRDFLAKPPQAWAPEIEALAPLPKKYKLRPAPDLADELFEKFKTYLPALRQSAA